MERQAGAMVLTVSKLSRTGTIACRSILISTLRRLLRPQACYRRPTKNDEGFDQGSTNNINVMDKNRDTPLTYRRRLP